MHVATKSFTLHLPFVFHSFLPFYSIVLLLYLSNEDAGYNYRDILFFILAHKHTFWTIATLVLLNAPS